MFCIYCGKSIVENASFCAFCGKPIEDAQTQSSTNSWEYTFYGRWWKSGKGGRYNLLNGKTEYSIRLDLWGNDESSTLKEIQEFIDLGWQPITPPGPGCYNFVKNTANSKDTQYTWLEVLSFIVEFRRPAQARTAREKEIIGVWEQIYDQNDSFWNKLVHVIFSRQLEMERVKIEFRNDKTFTLINRDGKGKEEGVFGEIDGEISLAFKYSPELNTNAMIVGDRLSYKDQYGDVKLERIKK